MQQPEFLPQVGHPVVTKFATDGNGSRIKGGSAVTTDSITAVYAETDVVKNSTGDLHKAYNVRVSSGDVFKVIKGDRAWLAVA